MKNRELLSRNWGTAEDARRALRGECRLSPASGADFPPPGFGTAEELARLPGFTLGPARPGRWIQTPRGPELVFDT